MKQPTNDQTVAREALESLTTRLADHRILNIQCRHGHHVAAVYETPAGLIYRAGTGPHAHGSKDFVDTAHGSAVRGNEYTDLLHPDPMASDELPAWCDCGHRTLSRGDLLASMHAGKGTIHLR
ncbi:hypothetical protein [Nocardioides sp.]|uniref:hypothetical protein n=1 Tax=Nocardioides sp. TaxID=35761 RepID=UPI00356753F2